jgi:hypothetical protein
MSELLSRIHRLVAPLFHLFCSFSNATTNALVVLVMCVYMYVDDGDG